MIILFCLNRAGMGLYRAVIQDLFLLSDLFSIPYGAKTGTCTCALHEDSANFRLHPPPLKEAAQGRELRGCNCHKNTAKGRIIEILPFAVERKTDFRPKHIPRSQSAHYVKHSPRKSLPRCGHHALVCIPMLSTKIRNLQSKYKLKIRFCAATALAAQALPSGSIRRVARTKVPRPAGLCQSSVCGRCSRSVRR